MIKLSDTVSGFLKCHSCTRDSALYCHKHYAQSGKMQTGSTSGDDSCLLSRQLIYFFESLFPIFLITKMKLSPLVFVFYLFYLWSKKYIIKMDTLTINNGFLIYQRGWVSIFFIPARGLKLRCKVYYIFATQIINPKRYNIAIYFLSEPFIFQYQKRGQILE